MYYANSNQRGKYTNKIKKIDNKIKIIDKRRIFNNHKIFNSPERCNIDKYIHT